MQLELGIQTTAGRPARGVLVPRSASGTGVRLGEGKLYFAAEDLFGWGGDYLLSLDESDGAAGLYLHGGFDAWVAPNVALGIGYRLVTGADLSLGGEDVSGDYSQVTLSVGFSF